jgi:hypothetical protein
MGIQRKCQYTVTKAFYSLCMQKCYHGLGTEMKGRTTKKWSFLKKLRCIHKCKNPDKVLEHSGDNELQFFISMR